MDTDQHRWEMEQKFEIRLGDKAERYEELRWAIRFGSAGVLRIIHEMIDEGVLHPGCADW